MLNYTLDVFLKSISLVSFYYLIWLLEYLKFHMCFTSVHELHLLDGVNLNTSKSTLMVFSPPSCISEARERCHTLTRGAGWGGPAPDLSARVPRTLHQSHWPRALAPAKSFAKDVESVVRSRPSQGCGWSLIWLPSSLSRRTGFMNYKLCSAVSKQQHPVFCLLPSKSGGDALGMPEDKLLALNIH